MIHKSWSPLGYAVEIPVGISREGPRKIGSIQGIPGVPLELCFSFSLGCRGIPRDVMGSGRHSRDSTG